MFRRTLLADIPRLYTSINRRMSLYRRSISIGRTVSCSIKPKYTPNIQHSSNVHHSHTLSKHFLSTTSNQLLEKTSETNDPTTAESIPSNNDEQTNTFYIPPFITNILKSSNPYIFQIATTAHEIPNTIFDYSSFDSIVNNEPLEDLVNKAELQFYYNSNLEPTEENVIGFLFCLAQSDLLVASLLFSTLAKKLAMTPRFATFGDYLIKNLHASTHADTITYLPSLSNKTPVTISLQDIPKTIPFEDLPKLFRLYRKIHDEFVGVRPSLHMDSYTARLRRKRRFLRLTFFTLQICAIVLAYMLSQKIFPSNIVSGTTKVLGGDDDEAFTIYNPLTDPSPTTLDDVLGVDEVVTELREIVDIIKNRDYFTEGGARIPRGILLSGPPGTGKTMVARAIAAECGIPFLHAPASSFDKQILGSGKDRVQELFRTAKELGECIIFIDEIDTLGKRNEAASVSNMTLNALLVELDGFSSSSKITIIGATNLPEKIDPALIRPGRLGKHLTIPLPDINGREKILKYYMSRVIHDPDIDLRRLARGTIGSSGAYLKSMINQAAFEAARRGKDKVTAYELEYANDKLLMGHPRDNFVMPASEAKRTAYHEGGHALLAVSTKGSMPVYKATIMPRGPALGYVQQVPEKEMIYMTNEQMLARIDVALAGRAAEEIIYGHKEVTTGASNDYEQASRLAMYMVNSCGFSPLGIVSEDYEKMSEERKYEVEMAAVAILSESYERVTTYLKQNVDKLHKLANALIEHETLEKTQIYDAIEDRPIQKYTLGQSLSSKKF